MGCVMSSVERSSLPSSRLFDVYNIDERGQERNPGKIEVGDQDLVLHQLGKDSIRWPLRSLRRYGFDAQLFSFESGRRCVTGPGIYAFKCHRAEVLFNVLQESIIRAGQLQEVNRGHSTTEPRGGLLPMATVSSSEWISFQHFLSSNHVAAFVASPATNDYVNESPLLLRHDYVNNDVKLSASPAPSVGSSGIKYAELKLSKTTLENPGVDNDDDNDDDDDDDDEPDVFTSASLFPSGSSIHFKCSYVNLPSPYDGAAGNLEFGVRGHEYMNLGKASGCGGGGGDGGSGGGGSGQCHAENSAAVTYAQLDLDVFGEETGDLNQSQSKGRPSIGSGTSVEMERTKPDAYASIDFQKTRALNSRVEDEPPDKSYRKTRHNSTIEVKCPTMN